MNESEARSAVTNALSRVAPEVEVERLDPAADLQDEADLDSMDFLHLVEQISATTGTEIPERDYRNLATLQGFIAYLVETSRERSQP